MSLFVLWEYADSAGFKTEGSDVFLFIDLVYCDAAEYPLFFTCGGSFLTSVCEIRSK